jgi:hypothetical protein
MTVNVNEWVLRPLDAVFRRQAVEATPSGIKLLSKVVFMTQEKRFGLSAVQKSDMWRRWKAGQSLHEIGRAFGKEHSSIRCLVSRYGGFVPPIRRRSLLALTLREHYNQIDPSPNVRKSLDTTSNFLQQQAASMTSSKT